MPASTTQWLSLFGYVTLAYVVTRGSLVILYELTGLLLQALGSPVDD